jgi:hypothetical protein
MDPEKQANTAHAWLQFALAIAAVCTTAGIYADDVNTTMKTQ